MIVFIVNWYRFWSSTGSMFGFDISCVIAQDTCVAWYPAYLDVDTSAVEYIKLVDEISNNWVIISVMQRLYGAFRIGEYDKFFRGKVCGESGPVNVVNGHLNFGGVYGSFLR